MGEVDEEGRSALLDLGEKVSAVNAALAAFVKRYGEGYSLNVYVRIRDDDPPELDVTVRRDLARFR